MIVAPIRVEGSDAVLVIDLRESKLLAGGWLDPDGRALVLADGSAIPLSDGWSWVIDPPVDWN